MKPRIDQKASWRWTLSQDMEMSFFLQIIIKLHSHAVIAVFSLCTGTVAAVDSKVRARHEPRAVAEEEHGGRLEVFGRAQPVEHGAAHPGLVQLGFHVQQLLGHGSYDITGRDGVDADAILAPLLAQRPRELQHGGLGRVVRRVFEPAVHDNAGHRANQHNRARRPFCHQDLGRVLGHDERAHKVDVDDLAVQLDGVLDGRQLLVDAGAVHQAVDRSACLGGLLSKPGQQQLDGRLTGDVERVEREGPAAFLGERLRGGPLFGEGLWQQVQSHCAAACLENGRDKAQAEATGAAGDEVGPVSQVQARLNGGRRGGSRVSDGGERVVRLIRHGAPREQTNAVFIALFHICGNRCGGRIVGPRNFSSSNNRCKSNACTPHYTRPWYIWTAGSPVSPRMYLGLKGRNLQWGVTIASGAGFLLFGFDQGVMSGLLTGAAFTHQFPSIDTTDTGHGSSSLQGTVVAIYEIGCFFGALFSFALGEQLGRRWSIMLGCIILSIGAAIQTSAYGVPQLIVGRIVAGLGNGMNTATIPVWHSEICKAHNRGRELSIELAINIFGVMTSYWVDYGMSYVDSEAQFRFPISLQILFALFTLAGVMFLPESPRWLIAHDRHAEAKQVIHLTMSNAEQITDDDPSVAREIEQINEALAEERESASVGFAAVFSNGRQRFFWRTFLGMFSQFMQQLSGINLITYYATSIFEESVGMDHNLALLMSGFNGIAYFVSSLLPIWLLDRVGRRKLMMFAVIGQGSCMAILAGTVSNGNTACGIVATVMLFMFNFFFSVGLLAIPWLLPAEYAPLAIRTKAAALGSASNWIFTFLVVEITPSSVANIGYKTYIYFCVFNFCFLPMIYFFYPETKNLPLEKIDRMFVGEKVHLFWNDALEDDYALVADKTANKAEVEMVESGVYVSA
ncbi:hypothetical protein KL943_003808 [Ogataea angusta]|nr:hypothetical protein KL943_003808 [Ogataea angusta]